MVKIYRFQRLMIAAAVIIWAVFAGRLVYKGIKGETMDVVDTFCENVYYDISADISATGKLDNGMSDTAKKLMMTQMAKTLGLNRYNITEDETGIYLTQQSVNGSADISIKKSSTGEFFITDIELYKGFESTSDYEKLMKQVLEEYGIDTHVTVSMKGSIAGDMSQYDKSEVSGRMLKMLGAKTVTTGQIQDSYVVYAYAKSVKDSVSIGKNKINVNITMNYDETRGVTDIQLSTPI